MKYAIFGAGIVGEQFLTEYEETQRIDIVFDNQKKGIFHFREIKKPEYRKELFIIVTSNRYFEIRKQLLGLGYSEFADFIPYQIFGKKMAIAYGNCHIDAVKAYLENKKAFAQDYGFYPFPGIQEMDLLENYERVLPYCELFLHQSIRKENKFGEKCASEAMMKYLSKGCQVISVPNLYRMPECFFPQQRLDNRKGLRGVFYFCSGEDENVRKWIREGRTEEDIKGYMVKGGVYKKEEILNKWEQFQEKLLKREEEWDIKISDYIFANYKSKKLFYERVHISNFLVKEIAARILKYMGYDEEIPLDLPYFLDSHEMFIYEDVVNALELEFKQRYIRVTQKCYSLNQYAMDIEEYIHQLCKWSRVQNRV
ncbi:MAG: hypothetical protein HFJ10_09655 [Lachnospiraceae bacterium]|nr:hypothetical protein [Lachnospiraceae bacterium]